MLGFVECLASMRVALQSVNRTPGRETASSLISRRIGWDMRPSSYATYIMGLLEQKSRTKFSKFVEASSERERPSEFILDSIELSISFEALIRPCWRMDS